MTQIVISKKLIDIISKQKWTLTLRQESIFNKIYTIIPVLFTAIANRAYPLAYKFCKKVATSKIHVKAGIISG